MASQPIQVQEFYDAATNTLSYVVWDKNTCDGVVIDPVLAFDAASEETDAAPSEAIDQFLKKQKIHLRWILETHAHADHLSGAQVLVQSQKVGVAISSGICEVQKTFKEVFKLADFKTDGSQFSKLLKDGEVLTAGSLKIKVLHTPGHTPACATFVIGDRAFTGDALFMPDSGTGRCDFPNGSAKTLYHSITQKIFALPDTTQIFVGHDYQPGGRALQFQTTVAEQKRTNIHLRAETTCDEFVAFREGRDRTLKPPKLLMPSLRANIDAGRVTVRF